MSVVMVKIKKLCWLLVGMLAEISNIKVRCFVQTDIDTNFFPKGGFTLDVKG